MTIKIDIPGIGQVTAENAASEDTLQQILAVITEIKKTTTPGAAKQAPSTSLNVSQTVQAMKNLTSSALLLTSFLSSAKAHLGEFNSQLKNFSSTVFQKFIVGFDQAAEQPINTAKTVFDAGVQGARALGHAATTGTKAIGELASGIPVIGGLIGGAVKAISSAGDAAIDLAASLATVANELLATELNKSIESMKIMAQSGASFAGGMIEMRTLAHESGLGIRDFAKIVAGARESVYGMGTSATEAAIKLSAGLAKLNVLTGDTGRTLRNELLAIGYSYEEQGDIMAQYSANMQTAGKLRSMSDFDVARGTVQYAKDLKVLADITGKNAKAAAESARLRALEADVMSSFASPDERAKFQAALRSMPDDAKKGFLEFVASGGTTVVDAGTNIMMSRNREFSTYYADLYSGIRDRTKTETDIQKETLIRNAKVRQAEEQRIAAEGDVLAQAKTLAGGIGAAGDSAVSLTNSFLKAQYDPSIVEKSTNAVKNMGHSADPVTEAFTGAYDATKKFQVVMERLIGEYGLPKYATLLDKSFSALIATMRKAGIEIPESEYEKELKIKESTEKKERVLKALERTIGKEEAIGSLGVEVGEGVLPEYENGGIATGPNSGFSALLHGTEAVVPLPDGRSIPVNIKVLDSVANNQQMLATAIEQMQKISQSMYATAQAGTTSNTSIPVELTEKFNQLNTSLSELRDAARAQLEKHEQMIRHLQDQKDISERMLNNSY